MLRNAIHVEGSLYYTSTEIYIAPLSQCTGPVCSQFKEVTNPQISASQHHRVSALHLGGTCTNQSWSSSLTLSRIPFLASVSVQVAATSAAALLSAVYILHSSAEPCCLNVHTHKPATLHTVPQIYKHTHATLCYRFVVICWLWTSVNMSHDYGLEQ